VKARRIAIIGAGGLARSFARALTASGVQAVIVAARRPGRAKAIAREHPGLRAAAIDDAVAAADTIFLAVPDGALAAVAAGLVPMRASWRGVVALHAAGAVGTEPLRALAARGAATGVLHPLAALDRSGRGRLEGAAARIEGVPRAAAEAKRLAGHLGLTPMSGRALSSPSGRRLYHAAASLASNDVLGLLVAARDLLVRSGIGKAAATRALLSLVEGAVAQARARGLAASLTGPVVRGDDATLVAHLAVLEKADPLAAAAHLALSARLVEFAAAEGRLNPAARRRVSRALARGRSRGRTV
jgi:predicted short-subunit dehydrogenase-like oxidoreductase (DUF2520 family)